MPPKAPIIRQQSASPVPPPAIETANDLLVVQDIVDTLDAMPGELTRALGDLRELDAVLTSTLASLNEKLVTLISWIQDDSVSPAKRFHLLQEIAEEAARFKLGGDDKIRVAGGACDGIMSHQKHISNLLAASTLLQQGQASPYTQSLTLGYVPPQSTTRRGVAARAANSPFGGRAYASGSGNGGALGLTADRERETPTKKKKNRVQQLGMGVTSGVRDDDDISVGGKDDKKKAVKKRKPTNRAVSPTDSLTSTNAGYTNKVPEVARTARQIAAAAARAKANQANDESDEDEVSRKPNSSAMAVSPSADSLAADRRDGALGLELGAASREGSLAGGKSGNPTPVLASATVVSGEKGGRSVRVRTGVKRGRNDEEDEDESEEEDKDEKPPAKRTGSGKKGTNGMGSIGGNIGDVDMHETDGGVGESEVDSRTYCTCNQVSYGEMIGCDDDDCEIEWYHLNCLDLDRPPEGNWICPRCAERRKKNPKAKKSGKGGKRGGK